MKQKLLKLIKILKRFSIDDLITMSEFEESEIINILQEFEQEKIINKISKTEYGYIVQRNVSPQDMLLFSKNNTQKYNEFKLKKEDIANINVSRIFPKENELEIYNNSPDWAKTYLIKYTTVLKLTGKLRGEELKEFLKKLSEEHPEYKMSYSTLIKLRQRYSRSGFKGLIPRYIKNKERTLVPKYMYEEFKKLYLSEKVYSIRKCIDIISNIYPNEIVPSGASFKRLLLKEYSLEMIDKLRSIPDRLPTLNVKKQETNSNVKAPVVDNSKRSDLFIEGAKYYLKNIKDKGNKKNESEICRVGYIKNHLIPYFKDFKFKDITQEVLSKYASAKLAQGYSIASIGRFVSTLSIVIEKHSTVERQFNFTNDNAASLIPDINILTDCDIRQITKNNTPELWYLALGIKPAELDALNYEDIDFKSKIVKINKIRIQGKVQKYRTIYQTRELKIPNIIFSKLKHLKGKIFEEVESTDFDVILNTHIKLMLNKNVQMNIISKNLGFQSVSDFESRYNFLLPQSLDEGFEII